MKIVIVYFFLLHFLNMKETILLKYFDFDIAMKNTEIEIA